ncbi:MAG: hypothetical protein ACM3SQ_01895 [Betaproteobacteria bacterium]
MAAANNASIAVDAVDVIAIPTLANLALCLLGGYVAAASRPVGRAIARAQDLNLFRLRPDTRTVRRRWEKSHSLAALIVGIALLAFGLWRLLAQYRLGPA